MKDWRPGFSLIEMVVVIAILAVVAGLVIWKADGIQERAAYETTKTSLNTIRDAILGTPGGKGYRPDMGTFPSSLSYLVSAPGGATQPAFNPFARVGWRGPYLETTSQGSPAFLDGWGRSINYIAPNAATQTAGSLTSAGPDGIMGTSDDISVAIPYQ